MVLTAATSLALTMAYAQPQYTHPRYPHCTKEETEAHVAGSKCSSSYSKPTNLAMELYSLSELQCLCL